MNLIYLLVALSSLFLMVQADAQQDVETCRVACEVDFRPKVVSIIPRSSVYTEFEALIPSWKTCQYRCYRCHLTGMTKAMDRLGVSLSGPEQSERLNVEGMVSILNAIDISFKDTCYKRWVYANRYNDTASKFL